MKIKIAYFISPHGFGHAARSAAIMEALNEINDNIEFHLFTLVPRWFFKNSKISNFKYNELLSLNIQAVIVGLLQELSIALPIFSLNMQFVIVGLLYKFFTPLQ